MPLATEPREAPGPRAAGEVAPAGKSPRYVLVDALRGVAATWVIFVHAWAGHHVDAIRGILPGWLNDLASNGRIPVTIFFVLSGFVIAYSVSRYKVDARFVGRFALRRSIRLDPPYWASIALTVGMALLSRYMVAGKVYEPPTPSALLLHMAYLQEIVGVPEINPAFWTLCLEIQFYLAFCLLLAISQRLRRDESDRRSLHAIFLPCMILSAAYPLGLVPEAYSLPGWFPASWHRFLIGVAACWAMLGWLPRPVFYGLLLLLCAGLPRSDDVSLLTCIATAGLLYLASRLGTLTTWLNYRWLLFLGSISYSLYLIHNPITGAFYRVAYRLTGHGLAAEVFWFAPMVAVNVAFAYGFWWLFERTSLAFGHRVRMNPPTRPEPPEIEPASSVS